MATETAARWGELAKHGAPLMSIPTQDNGAPRSVYQAFPRPRGAGRIVVNLDFEAHDGGWRLVPSSRIIGAFEVLIKGRQVDRYRAKDVLRGLISRWEDYARAQGWAYRDDGAWVAPAEDAS